jgi:hypothetical protein
MGSLTKITSSAPASRISITRWRMSLSVAAVYVSETGRSPADASVTTSKQALRFNVAGSRPTPRAISEMCAFCLAKPSAELPNQSNQVFHHWAWGRAARRTRSPIEPIMSGIGRFGGGKSTASSTLLNLPANVQRSPEHKVRNMVKASSKREPRWSKGMPNASNSG